MKVTDKVQEESPSITPLKTTSMSEEIINSHGRLPQVEKPLIRYFDLIDDANDSYVLGYN